MPRLRLLLVLMAVVLAPLSMSTSPAAAATRTTFVARATFEAAVSPGFITDSYAPANGYPPGFGVYSNAQMSAFFNQTDYFTTGHSNVNIVGGFGAETYCAGCNGSFLLFFQSTTLTQGGVGVYGVGVDIVGNSAGLPYTAYVTYGDATTENFPLPVGASFFGLTSPQLIQSIHFGLANGTPTTSGSFGIDNLTLGAAAASCSTTSVLLYNNNPIFNAALLALQNAGYTPTQSNQANFVTLLTSQVWDLVVLDNPSSEPAGAWQVALQNHIAGGGRAIHTHWNSGSLTAGLQGAFDITHNGTHDTQTFYQWNAHPVFNTPQSVSGTFDVWQDIWGSNGFFLDVEPASGGVAAAGFVPAPAANQAAIVIGNSGRTIFNGFLFDDFFIANKDADALPDIVELIINEIALVCGTQQEPGETVSDLSITKTASANPVIAGTNLTYNVSATNNGPDTAQDVQITDNLPPGAAFVSATPSAGATCSLPPVGSVGGTVSCTWAGPTTVGQVRTITIVVRVCPETSCTSTLNNTATVSAGGGGGGGPLTLWAATSGFEDSELYTIDPATGSATFVGSIGFTNVSGLEVLDDGRLVAAAGSPNLEAQLIDIDRGSGAGTLIGNISDISSGCARMPDIAYDAANDILYGYGDFCGGAPEGLFTIDQSSGAGTSVGPSGFGGGGNGLGWQPGTGALIGTPFDQQSLVLFNPVTGAGASIPGTIGNVPFRINSLSFHPTSGDLYGIWNGPGYNLVTFDLITGSPTVIGSLPDRLDALVFEQGAGGGASDPNPANNTASTVTGVSTQSNLGVTKTGAPNPVLAGSNVTYNLTVSNAGPSNSVNTILTDSLPAQSTFVSAVPSQGSCSHAAGVVTCNLGTVGAPNQCTTAFPQIVTVTIVAQVNPDAESSEAQFGCSGPPLTNVASVTGGNTACGPLNLPDPNLANNSTTNITQIRAGSDVVINDPTIIEVTEGGTPVLAAPEGTLPDATLAGPEGSIDPLQVEECIAPGDFLQVNHVFSNTGPNAFTAQLDNPGPEFRSNLPGSVVGVTGSCVVLQGGGTCVITDSLVEWNGTIAVGETIEVQYMVRVVGGQEIGSEVCITGQVLFSPCNTGTNSATRSATLCVALNCAPTVDPNRQLGAQVHLPIMNFQGQNDVCRTWIEVQNIGDEFSKAALVVWGEPGFCPPQCAGPLKVECSGLLKPGSTWNFLGAQVPSGSKSGILFSFTARQLSQIGVDLGFDDIVADVMCETLFFGVVGDCDDYRRFKKAYNEGLDFAGIPQDLAVGSFLAVEVLRHCPGDVTPGVEVSSKYGGIAGTHLGAYDPVFGGYAYYVPLIYAQSADFNTIMYIQNGGLECSSVEIWFKAQDDCLRARICEIFTLAPGESFQWDANDCVGPDFVGSAWLRSSQPMGIAVDIIGRDVLMTYIGEPTELNYTFDPNQAFITEGNQVAYGPLMYSEYQGWDSGVQVQNLSSTVAAKAKVYFLDRGGDIITTLVDWICPRGSQTFFLPVVADLPGNWVGSIRVESQEWWSPGDPLVLPPNIVGIVTLIKYTDAARSDTAEAIAYNLLPEHKAYDWQLGFAAGGLESGVGLIAIPSLVKDLDGTGITTELAIANLVPKPGFTDFGIYIYDQNGLLDLVCEKLNEKQVEYIDLDTWGYVSNGFKGSAVISAVFWEHDVFDDTGFFLRNLLGLAAVVVERTGTRLGEDVPGDESAGTAGIPFRESEEEDNEFFFDFEGPNLPVCPGVPITRPEPGACPETITFSCDDCPQPILDLQTIDSFIDISANELASGCEIEDVDLLLDLTHTFDGDLVVDLSSPDVQDVPMFANICGASQNMQTILDDEAAAPIGSVCPPSGFQRFNTAPPGGLTLFEGNPATGTWRLDIQDTFGADAGTLTNWELQFTIAQ